MTGFRKFIVAASAVMVLFVCGQQVRAETWQLAKDGGFKQIGSGEDDRFMFAVSQIKQMVDTGQVERASEGFAKLQKDFPRIAGPDLEAFIKAEMLLCKGKFTKAARSYEKFLNEYPESKLYDAALERTYSIAIAYLGGQKKRVLKIFKMRGYAEGAKMMERIGDRTGKAPIAMKAAVAVAQSYEKRGKFEDAYFQWSEISSRWPTGQLGRDALLAMARCKHAAYKGPPYDASNLISAKSYYENFKVRYPKQAQSLEIDKRIGLINEQLAYKQYQIGRYYEKSGNKQSANFYYQMILDDWPQSTAAKMITAAIDREKTEK